MAKKADYLRKYLDGVTTENKRKKRVKKRANLTVHDDDVDWRVLTSVSTSREVKEDEPDDAPQVAEFKDDSVKRWMPVSDSRLVETGEKAIVVSHQSITSEAKRKTKRRMDSPDLSQPGVHGTIDNRPRKRSSLSPDISPPRGRNLGKKGEAEQRMDSPDESPPKIHDHNGKNKDAYELPRHRRSWSSDLSPPRGKAMEDQRKAKRRMDSPDLSPPRMYDRTKDLPLHHQRSSSSDLSPPRMGGKQTKYDISPPRRRQALAGKRRRPWSPNILSDDSPVRSKHKYNVYPDDDDYDTSNSRTKMDSLKSANKFDVDRPSPQELDVVHNQEQCSELPSIYMNAETVYRNKQGRKIDPKAEKIEKERFNLEEDTKFNLWGRGIAQARSAQQKQEDDLYEMSKPLARYADDEDLERMLREREREGDPMLAFIKRKVEKNVKQVGKARKAKPVYKGSAPPNRFMIRPGYRWDGVDRSNGFEKAWFTRESNKKAFNEEAYKWSVEDM